MVTKRQHYVPRVYLKAWETKVETNKEPDKKFNGVYCFMQGSHTGEGRRRESILYKNQLYTISFEQYLLTSKWTKVSKYFANEAYDIMRESNDKPVYGKLGYSIIRTKHSIYKHLSDINNWSFYYEDEKKASDKTYKNLFMDMKCNLLEDSFSVFYESKWEKILNTFIKKVHNPIRNQTSENLLEISNDVIIKDILKFFLVMLCRNPQFYTTGIYKYMTELLKKTFEGDETIDEIIKAEWLLEIYKIFYKNSGAYHNILINIINSYQILLYEAGDNEGSFITSDNPAFQHNDNSIKGEEGYYFPLSPKYVLRLSRKCKNDKKSNLNNICYNIVNKKMVKRINNLVKLHSNEMIISIEKNESDIL